MFNVCTKLHKKYRISKKFLLFCPKNWPQNLKKSQYLHRTSISDVFAIYFIQFLAIFEIFWPFLAIFLPKNKNVTFWGHLFEQAERGRRPSGAKWIYYWTASKLSIISSSDHKNGKCQHFLMRSFLELELELVFQCCQ